MWNIRGHEKFHSGKKISQLFWESRNAYIIFANIFAKTEIVLWFSK